MDSKALYYTISVPPQIFPPEIIVPYSNTQFLKGYMVTNFNFVFLEPRLLTEFMFLGLCQTALRACSHVE